MWSAQLSEGAPLDRLASSAERAAAVDGGACSSCCGHRCQVPSGAVPTCGRRIGGRRRGGTDRRPVLPVNVSTNAPCGGADVVVRRSSSAAVVVGGASVPRLSWSPVVVVVGRGRRRGGCAGAVRAVVVVGATVVVVVGAVGADRCRRAEARLRPDLVPQVLVDPGDVLVGRRRAPATREPHTGAAHGVAAAVLGAALDGVEPASACPRSSLARSGTCSRRCTPTTAWRCRPRTRCRDTEQRTWPRPNDSPLSPTFGHRPPRFECDLGPNEVLVDAPLARRPLEDLVGRAGEVARHAWELVVGTRPAWWRCTSRSRGGSRSSGAPVSSTAARSAARLRRAVWRTGPSEVASSASVVGGRSSPEQWSAGQSSAGQWSAAESSSRRSRNRRAARRSCTCRACRCRRGGCRCRRHRRDSRRPSRRTGGRCRRRRTGGRCPACRR